MSRDIETEAAEINNRIFNQALETYLKIPLEENINNIGKSKTETKLGTLARIEAIKIQQKELDKKNKNEDSLSGFIMDETKIHKYSIFPFCTFFKDKIEIAAFGFFLVKEVPEIYKEKNIGKIQKKFPVLIASDGSLLEYDHLFRENFAIKIDIPEGENYPSRWSLKSIKSFLNNEIKTIDGIRLFCRIKEIYQNYLYFFKDEWYCVHALWDMGTYFFLLFQYYPLLELRGLQGTAKTKIMTISRMISFNASEEMTNPSESTLFRETHNNRPTTYIDEAEKLFQSIKGNIIPDQRAEVINSGYKYTGSVSRQEKFGNRFRTITYKTYSPKMIASINGLYGATEDRAITHITTKAPQKDKRSEKEPEEKNSEWQQLRDELYNFALQNWKQIKDMYEAFPIDLGLKSRDYWLWKPLLVIAKFLDEDLYKKILKFSIESSNIKKIDYISEGSTEAKILTFMYELINERKLHAGRILVQDIAEKFGDDPYRPSNKSIARHIDNFGFKDFKQPHKKGTTYEVSKDLFENIIITIFPSLLSSSSSIDENNNYLDEEKMKQMKIPKVSDEVNEANETNEDVLHLALTTKTGILKFLNLKENRLGTDINKLLSLSDDQEKTEKLLEKMKKEGDIFYPTPEKAKVI